MTPQTHKLQSVQAFRGVAALLALLWHATIISKVYLDYDLMSWIFLFGYSGIDFFFVQSGFIGQCFLFDLPDASGVFGFLRQRSGGCEDYSTAVDCAGNGNGNRLLTGYWSSNLS